MTLEELAKHYSKVKQEIRVLEDTITTLNGHATELQNQIFAAMEEQGTSKFSIEGVGTVFTQDKLSVKTPKTPEDREAFFNYLKHTGQFEPMISVNSQTLQAWYKAQVESGITEIPGLREVTTYKQLILRKA